MMRVTLKALPNHSEIAFEECIRNQTFRYGLDGKPYLVVRNEDEIPASLLPHIERVEMGFRFAGPPRTIGRYVLGDASGVLDEYAPKRYRLTIVAPSKDAAMRLFESIRANPHNTPATRWDLCDPFDRKESAVVTTARAIAVPLASIARELEGLARATRNKN